MIVAASELAAVIVRKTKEMQDRELHMMTTGAENYGDYRELVGANRAFAAVLTLLDELTKGRGELV